MPMQNTLLYRVYVLYIIIYQSLQHLLLTLTFATKKENNSVDKKT